MKKVLIANRGEIAVRIARAATDANIASVAIYSDPDADALHVRRADEAYPLHGSTGADTYLNIEKIIQIAKHSGADAVHPGYGFLSENASFAQAVIDAGMSWIGPSPEAIEALGNKVTARQIAVRAGAPLAPGTDGPVKDAAEVRAFAEEYGVPVAIKAAFGGGGRGIKIAHSMDDIAESFESATREATVAFGRGECFVERFLSKPRHVEAQVLADTHGNVVVIGTRDCSLQRRHQKLVEEAPAPFLSDEQRTRIHESARAICKEAGYVGAGTVEYLVAQDGLISFLEVNTRLQVEHPITEETAGVDLVAEQFRIADGLPLSLSEDPKPTGHAFEFRINAEDPARGFLPAPGTIERFEAPTGAGVRVDTGVRSGSIIPPFYDSMIAKLIVRGADRDQALRRARLALEEINIAGVPTVLPFHRSIINHEAFTGQSLGVYTTWIEDEFLNEVEGSDDMDLDQRDTSRETITIELDGKAVQLGLPAAMTNALRNSSGAGAAAAAQGEEAGEQDASAVQSSMDGNLVRFTVEDGQSVEAGQSVAIIEAMKMESPVTAHRAGIFTAASISVGTGVRRGDTLGTIN
ncbi:MULTISPECIES: acetyl/propionyl/methylcrotonyl-CoA carboxylase subunit alpha [Glutamicibacter]|uniref:biotin carboxylase n=1 Tax=Glutamicibacter arilaitensis (strain DSM 16368 / CIP 108037 / IAM 15318 / JCM 13566 / NCIMB 14258 / Re117) TaxID=861360 RepID=A0ABM9PUJ8_GLUAR|nr:MULTISPECIES: biotin carboxylase N-terminal domain-containing protein [Glutamicibacter]CBT74866.1 acetyl-/propionyl-coenzyme A carboxylase alpha chain [Glutamicibacter arilaitensis Re117]HCH48947.1 ATP-grasp domain-containing protein [Glutamicibacter sp.]